MSDFDVITGPSIPTREPPPRRDDQDAGNEGSPAGVRPAEPRSVS